MERLPKLKFTQTWAKLNKTTLYLLMSLMIGCSWLELPALTAHLHTEIMVKDISYPPRQKYTQGIAHFTETWKGLSEFEYRQ